jgi:hypothetical protein
VKGINNRQKTIVKPRENVQKYLVQQKNLQKFTSADRRKLVGRGSLRKNK